MTIDIDIKKEIQLQLETHLAGYWHFVQKLNEQETKLAQMSLDINKLESFINQLQRKYNELAEGSKEQETKLSVLTNKVDWLHRRLLNHYDLDDSAQNMSNDSVQDMSAGCALSGDAMASKENQGYASLRKEKETQDAEVVPAPRRYRDYVMASKASLNAIVKLATELQNYTKSL